MKPGNRLVVPISVIFCFLLSTAAVHAQDNATLNGTYKFAGHDSVLFKFDAGPVMALVAADDGFLTFNGAGNCTISNSYNEFQEHYAPGQNLSTTPYFTQVSSSPETMNNIICTYSVAADGAVTVSVGGESVPGFYVSKNGAMLLRSGTQVDRGDNGNLNMAGTRVGMRLGTAMNLSSLNGTYKFGGHDSVLAKADNGPVAVQVAADEGFLTFNGAGSCSFTNTYNEFQEQYSPGQNLSTTPYFTQVSSSPETVTNAACTYTVAANGALSINAGGDQIAGFYVSADSGMLLRSGTQVERVDDGDLNIAGMRVGIKLGNGMNLSSLNGTYKFGGHDSTLAMADSGPVAAQAAADDGFLTFDGAGSCSFTNTYNEFQEQYAPGQNLSTTPYFTQVSESPETVTNAPCTYAVAANGAITIQAGGDTVSGFYVSGDGTRLLRSGTQEERADDNSGNLSIAGMRLGTKIADASGVTTKPGDCDNNGTVTIAEVQSAVGMFLGSVPVTGCVDVNNNGSVSIVEMQKVINGFLVP